MDRLIYINTSSPFILNTRYIVFIEPVANDMFNIVMRSGEKFQINKQIMTLLKDNCDFIVG